MALPASATIRDRGGVQPQAPTFVDKISHVGDDAYPTGGTLLYSDFVNARLFGDGSDPGRRTILDVVGYGFTAGAITHLVRYDKATDALLVFVLATGAEAGAAANLSGVTFELAVLSS